MNISEDKKKSETSLYKKKLSRQSSKSKFLSKSMTKIFNSNASPLRPPKSTLYSKRYFGHKSMKLKTKSIDHQLDQSFVTVDVLSSNEPKTKDRLGENISNTKSIVENDETITVNFESESMKRARNFFWSSFKVQLPIVDNSNLENEKMVQKTDTSSKKKLKDVNEEQPFNVLINQKQEEAALLSKVVSSLKKKKSNLAFESSNLSNEIDNTIQILEKNNLYSLSSYNESRLSIDSQKSIYKKKALSQATKQRKTMHFYAQNLFGKSVHRFKEIENEDDIVTPIEVLANGYQFLERVNVAADLLTILYEARRVAFGKLPYRVACKHVLVSMAGGGSNKHNLNSIKEEIKVLKKIQTNRHRFIVHVIDIIETTTDNYIIMKFAVNKTVFDYLYKFWMKPLPESYAKRWLHQLMLAIQHLHAMPIVHRQLKLENFLLDEQYQALLTDFGMAIMMNDKSKAIELLNNTRYFASDYMAPEIHLAAVCENAFYDPIAADIYSMGVCLFEMVNFYRPFAMPTSHDYHHGGLIHKQKNRKYVFNKRIFISQDCLDLIDQLLEPKPHVRPRATQVLNHSWLGNGLDSGLV